MTTPEPPPLPPLTEQDIVELFDHYRGTASIRTFRGIAYYVVEQLNAVIADRAARSPVPEPKPDVRIYWHAYNGWQLEWLANKPNGGQSNFYYAHPVETSARSDEPKDRP